MWPPVTELAAQQQLKKNSIKCNHLAPMVFPRSTPGGNNMVCIQTLEGFHPTQRKQFLATVPSIHAHRVSTASTHTSAACWPPQQCHMKPWGHPAAVACRHSSGIFERKQSRELCSSTSRASACCMENGITQGNEHDMGKGLQQMHLTCL